MWAAAASLVTLSFSASAFAQGSSWTSTTGGLWSDVANWSGGVVADGAGNTAAFGVDLLGNPIVDPTGDIVINLDSSRTIGRLSFGDADTTSAAGWTLGNNGLLGNMLTLDGAGVEGGNVISVGPLGDGKAVTISADIVANGPMTKDGAGALILSGMTSLNNQVLEVLGSGSLTVTGSVLGVSNFFVRGTSSLILEGDGSLTTGMNNNHISLGLNNGDNVTAVLRDNAVWSHIGGDFNVSDVDPSQASLTLSGSATLSSGGRIYVSKNANTVATLTVSENSNLLANENLVVGQGAGTKGTLTQSGGTIVVGNETWIGNNAGGDGTFTMTGGTLTGNNWFVVGRNGSNGVFNMSGGSITKTNGGNFIIGDRFETDGGSGEMTVSGTAELTIDNELWVGSGANTTGTLNIQGGTVTLKNWVAIGRGGGTGTLNVEGGTITKAVNDDAAFIVGPGGGTNGTLNQTGGTIAVTAGDTWLGESGTGTWNMSAGTLTSTNLVIGRNGAGQGTFNLSGTGSVEANAVFFGQQDTAQGTLNLNGGTLATNFMEVGTGTGQLNFNGGVVKARQDESDFLRGFSAANSEIQAGGLILDTAGFEVTVSTGFDGVGGLTKQGEGMLTLTGASTYTGETKVQGGVLLLSGFGTIAGDVSVADGAIFAGNGTVTGKMLLQSGARLAADSSLGTLTLQTGLDLNASGGNVLEFGLGADADLIAITGGTFLGNSSGLTTISLFEGLDFEPGVYTLIDWTDANASGVELADFQLAELPAGWTASLQLGPDSKSLQAEVVPEPSAAMLLGIAGAGLLGMRRRRTAK